MPDDRQFDGGRARHDAILAATPRQTNAKSRSIKSLTGVRGVAAVWVFLTHYQAVLAMYLDSPDIGGNRFLYNGFRGVDLFFILSGFILTHVHGEDFRHFSRSHFRDFYILRFFRVYPLNTIVLLVLIPVVFAMPDFVQWTRFDHGTPVPYHSHDFSAAGFVQSLLLAQTWTFAKLGEWNGPAWSLSAEIFGYALFPFVAWFMMRRRSAWGCVGYALASLATLMVLQTLGGHTQDSPTGSFGLIRMVFGFLAGVSLARSFQLLPAGARPGSRLGDRLGSLLTIASLLLIAGALSMQSANMYIVFGFAALILGLAFQSGPINAVMSSRPAMFFGRISFSLYLVHYIPLKMSLWARQTILAELGWPARVACLLAIILVCVGLAVLTHRTLEVRFQNYARTLLRAKHGHPAAQPAHMKTA